MSNSRLVDATYLSPNHYGSMGKIVGVTPHCYVGKASLASAGSWFGKSSTNASCNYYIDAEGRVALIVPESQGSWCSSSYNNDMSHVTIECASDSRSPYAFTDATYKKLVELTADIYRRNGISKAIWTGSKSSGNITVHRMFKQKECPGNWFMGKLNSGQFCNDVNALLGNSGGGDDTTESRLDIMMCLFNVADDKTHGGTDYFFDGRGVKKILYHEEAEILQKIFKDCTGRKLPYYTWRKANQPFEEVLAQLSEQPYLSCAELKQI